MYKVILYVIWIILHAIEKVFLNIVSLWNRGFYMYVLIQYNNYDISVIVIKT
jgi:hypothetical protein